MRLDRYHHIHVDKPGTMILCSFVAFWDQPAVYTAAEANRLV